MSFAWPLTGTPNPLVDKRYPALTLRAFTTEQTLVYDRSEPATHAGFYFILLSSCDFFLLSLHHACRFQLRCGTQALQALPSFN